MIIQNSRRLNSRQFFATYIENIFEDGINNYEMRKMSKQKTQAKINMSKGSLTWHGQLLWKNFERQTEKENEEATIVVELRQKLATWKGAVTVAYTTYLWLY